MKLGCGPSKIQEGADLLVQALFVKNVLATTLNSGMSAAAHSTPVAAFDSTTEPRI